MIGASTAPEAVALAGDAGVISGNEPSILVLAVAFACLIWYAVVVFVQAIGSTQLYVTF
jgi:hypothetical protein